MQVQTLNEKSINTIAKSYNTLDYIPRLQELLKIAYPKQDLTKRSKYELHQCINDMIIAHYKGEDIFKYQLAQKHFDKKKIVAAFEIKVNKSRADFLTINGCTRCYEIKSELDNFSKFEKQAADYLLAFEYNYLVVNNKNVNKALEKIPSNFGLWCYDNGEHISIKKAKLNTNIDPQVQLTLLTKKERTSNFKETGGIIKNIIRNYDTNQINYIFKKTLKERYRQRWMFLVTNKSSVLPIDLQFFFNNNINPNLIYIS